MPDICNDNRFELINKYKQKLIDGTNIETAQDEMAVINDILFRFWQMGWLDKLEQGWTPASEPPKKNGDYLVTFKMLFLRPVEVCTFADGQWNKFGYEKVLAWQPLPSPYTQE